MIAYLSILNIFNLLLLSVFLFFSKNRLRVPNRWLAVLLLCMAINATDYFFWNNSLTVLFPYLVTFSYISTSLIGPVFLFYVNAMLERPFNLRTSWIHFLPTLFFVGYYAFFQEQNSDVKLTYIRNAYLDYPIRELVLNAIASIQILTYLVTSFLLLRNQRRKQHDIQDNQWLIRYKWLEKTCLFLLLIFLVVSLLMLIVANERFNEWAGQVVLTILYVVLFVRTLQSPPIFLNATVKDDSQKRLSQTLDNDKLNNLFDRISEHIRLHQPYQKARYSSTELSQEIGITVHELSWAINQKTGHNYNHFINSYRVDMAKRELLSPENNHLTIQAIGQKCGFNSLSTFYEVFNRHTNLTPKSFKDAHEVQSFPDL